MLHSFFSFFNNDEESSHHAENFLGFPTNRNLTGINMLWAEPTPLKKTKNNASFIVHFYLGKNSTASVSILFELTHTYKEIEGGRGL